MSSYTDPIKSSSKLSYQNYSYAQPNRNIFSDPTQLYERRDLTKPVEVLGQTMKYDYLRHVARSEQVYQYNPVLKRAGMALCNLHNDHFPYDITVFPYKNINIPYNKPF